MQPIHLNPFDVLQLVTALCLGVLSVFSWRAGRRMERMAKQYHEAMERMATERTGHCIHALRVDECAVCAPRGKA